MNPFKDKLRHLIDHALQESETLSGVEERFEKRFTKERRKKRIQISSAVTTLLVLFMFITANTNTAWAETLKKIPVLKELFSYMNFSEDYEDQIEELGLVSDNGEHQLYLQYALSDDKQIRLYLQFPEYITLKEHEHLTINIHKVYDLKTGEDFTSSFINPDHAYPERFDHNYVSLFGTLPPGTELSYPDEIGISLSASIGYYPSSLYGKTEYVINEDLGQFSFETKLQKMMHTETKKIGKSISISGNSLLIKSIERSPLRASILLDTDSLNLDRVTSLKGTLIDPVSGEILDDDLDSLMYDMDGNIRAIFLDSDALPNNAFKCELVITGASLMAKDEEFVTIDFERKTIEPEVEGMELIGVSVGKKTAMWMNVRYKEPGVMFNPFHYLYETNDGKTEFLPHGSYGGVNDEFYNISLIFDHEINDTIRLRKRSDQYSKHVTFEEPIRITIDIPETFDPIH